MGQVVNAANADADLEAVPVERLHEGEVTGTVRMDGALAEDLRYRAAVERGRPAVRGRSVV